jgi:phosphoglycerate kinase
MRNIKQIKNIKGKKVLVRVDFNVPIKNGKVLDDFRIKAAIPTIEYLQKKGAKIVLVAHLGKGGETLDPVAKILNKFIKAKFIKETLGDNVQKAIYEMDNGQVLLLENLRNHKGEQEPSKDFAKQLANYADIYVNEAFSVDHRTDASIVLLPKLLPSYAGLQLEREIKHLSHTLKPKHPFLFILGGAKFSTKMPLIKKYLKSADYIFIGGALANDFLKAEGYIVGQSLVDNTDNETLRKLMKNKKIILPVDVIVKSGKFTLNKRIEEVSVDEYILDIGNETVKKLEPIIKNSKLILWNGPLGKYEDGGAEGTKKILKLIAGSKAESIIGGGDTVALISKMKLENKFSFVSTGGGSTLDFLSSGTLPGIKALK